jgi:hypothetical protein
MNPLDILRGWFDPILTPLTEFRQQTAMLDTIHSDSVQQLDSLVTSLTQSGSDAFTGEAADAFTSLTTAYVTTETSLSQGGVGVLSAAAKLCEDAEGEMLVDIEQTAGQVTEEGPLIEITGAIDVTTAAQAGLDVPEDVVAGGATSITFAMIAQLVVDLLGLIGVILWIWNTSMQMLGNQPLPKLPPTPHPITPPKTKQPPVGSTQPNNQQLGEQEEQIAQQLSKEFGNAVSIDDIREIIRNNPNLTKDQYRLLVENYRRTGKMPYNVLSVVGVGTNRKGSVSKIFFVTQGDIAHIRGGHSYDFDTLSDQQLANLLTQLLEEDPQYKDVGTDSDTYYYDNVEVDGRYEEVAIVVSKKTPGRIVTSYIVV